MGKKPVPTFHTRSLGVSLGLAFLVSFNSGAALGQSSGGTFQVTSSVVAGGGGQSSDGANNGLSHQSTIGEHAAGTLLRNFPFSQTAGFQAANFGSVPTAEPATISGQVTTIDGAPLAGVTIILTGSKSLRSIIDSSGLYSFGDVEVGGLYVATPSRANYSFNPANRAFSLFGNKTDAIFTATPLAITANPLDTDLFFVRQQYLDFLGREPDQAGLEYWTTQLENCSGDQQCLNNRRIVVSAAFFIETEFQQTGSFVYRMYKGALGRQITYAEFNSDRNQVIGGSTLEQNKTALADNFVRRPEFIGKYSNAATADAFVSTLIQTIQRSTGIDVSEQRDGLIAAYNSGSEMNQSRSLVVRAAIETAAFKQAVYNSSFVLVQYFGYLHRDPEQAGYDFWLNVLNNKEPHNYRGMVCSFITSAEYQLRFGGTVTRSNGDCR